MLIVEGPDDVGKSTFCKMLIDLAERCSIPAFPAHMSRPNLNLFNFFSHYVDRMSKDAVQDRFHLGGLVYHPEQFCVHKLRIVEAHLNLLGSITVVIYTEPEFYRERAAQGNREQMYDLEKMVSHNQTFMDIATGHHELRPQVDYSIMTDRDRPYPTEDQARRILNQWMLRRMSADNCRNSLNGRIR